MYNILCSYFRRFDLGACCDNKIASFNYLVFQLQKIQGAHCISMIRFRKIHFFAVGCSFAFGLNNICVHYFSGQS